MKNKFDVTVIGAGVVGSAVARELSRYNLSILVLEKEMDVATGNSARNTGMIHAGFTYKPGSLKAECAVEGNKEFDKVAKELGVPFKRTGKLVVGFSEEDKKNIEKYKKIGELNGVNGIKMIDSSEILKIEPNANGKFAMYIPSSGIVDPMRYNIALADNAAMNGANFLFNQEIKSIDRIDKNTYKIKSQDSEYETKWIINCAGMYASEISKMLGYPKYPVKGFKGEYYVLDKMAGKYLSIPVYPAPNEKGGFSTHATPTIDGNILVGPDSYVTDDFEDYINTKSHMDELFTEGVKMFKNMKREYFIRNFAGIRRKRYDEKTGEILDFLLESKEENPHTVNLVGIESPGLTCALPLARRAVKILVEKEVPKENKNFNPIQIAKKPFREMTNEEKSQTIKENPLYGEIVCRCENITKAEILDAIKNPLSVHTITGIKNRCRATMGRCQGGYCMTRITEIIEKEYQESPEYIMYSKNNSYLFRGRVK